METFFLFTFTLVIGYCNLSLNKLTFSLLSLAMNQRSTMDGERNTLLADLRREREARHPRVLPPPPKRLKTSSASIDLTSDDDESDSGNNNSSSSSSSSLRSVRDLEASSLALASQRFASDAEMAQRLQLQELDLAKQARGGLDFQSMVPNMQEGSVFLNTLRRDMDAIRMSCEGPPTAPLTLARQADGAEQQCRRATRPWDDARPCVVCDDEACAVQLRELSGGATKIHSSGGLLVLGHYANRPLLQLLCAWRQHIRETFLLNKRPGETRWRKTSICTSLLTFLGRGTAKGGVIGALATTRQHITGVATLTELTKEGVKGLSAGNCLLIALKMNWGFAAADDLAALCQLLKKVRKRKGAHGPNVTTNPYSGTPFGWAFDLIVAKKLVPPTLRHCILSRAHLP